MWHLLYIIAFAVLAVLAISNLVRNLIILGSDARRDRPNQTFDAGAREAQSTRPVPHPELLDEDGNVIREPLLVMRSISMKDAREQLDALFEASSSGEDTSEDPSKDSDA